MESIKIFFEEETPDLEELKEDIAATSRHLADLKAKLYIAEHKGEKSAKMKKLLKREAIQKKEHENFIRESVSPSMKAIFEMISFENYLLMLKDMGFKRAVPTLRHQIKWQKGKEWKKTKN